MTFPHIEPEFKLKKESSIPDYLTPEHIKLVQDINNAVMEVKIKCMERNKTCYTDCFECGNDVCFEAFKAQAKLWGMSFDEYINSYKKQEQEAEKAVKEQAYRYAKYYADYNLKLINGDIGKDKNKGVNKPVNTKNGLFE